MEVIPIIKLCYVYALVHDATGKIYVGSTSHAIEFRLRTHISALRNHYHPNEAMQADYDKYGDGYSYYILYASSEERVVRDKEKEFMSILHTRDPQIGYNFKDWTKDLTLDKFHRNKVPDSWGREGNKKLNDKQLHQLVR